MNIPEKLGIVNELKYKSDQLLPAKDWDQAFLEKIKIEFTYKRVPANDGNKHGGTFA